MYRLMYVRTVQIKLDIECTSVGLAHAPPILFLKIGSHTLHYCPQAHWVHSDDTHTRAHLWSMYMREMTFPTSLNLDANLGLLLNNRHIRCSADMYLTTLCLRNLTKYRFRKSNLISQATPINNLLFTWIPPESACMGSTRKCMHGFHHKVHAWIPGWFSSPLPRVWVQDKRT